MDKTLLDTKLHTRFAIFLYAFQLETAMLTRRVYLDAADAERLVSPSQTNRLEILHRPAPDVSSY